MKFQGFQHLYQQFRASNPRLVDTFDRIHEYLNKLANENAGIQSGTIHVPIPTGPLAITFDGSFGLVNIPLVMRLIATGGLQPYTFSISAGTIPSGMTLDTTTGIISGTPDTEDTYTFTGMVTDANAVTATVDCVVVIAPTGTPALAPNIVAATVNVTFQIWSAVTVPVFSGTFTLPHDLGTLYILEIFYYDPSTKDNIPIARFDSGFTADGVISYSGWDSQIRETSADQINKQLKFVVYNSSFIPTPSPFTLTGITIPGYSISSFSVTEGTFWQDAGSALHKILDFHLSLNYYPQFVTLWTDSPQYGRIMHGWFLITASGVTEIGAQNSRTIFYPPTKTLTEDVICYASIGTFDEHIDPTTTPGYVSYTVTVHGPGVPANNLATGWYITSATPTYASGPAGTDQLFGWTILGKLPIHNPIFFAIRMCIQTGKKVGGTFIPGGQHPLTPDPRDMRTVVGDYAGPTEFYQKEDHADNVALINFATGQIRWDNPNLWDVMTDGFNVIRFFIFLQTRQDDGLGGTFTQQNCWSAAAGNSTAGTQPFQELVIDAARAVTDSKRLKPLGRGLTAAPDGTPQVQTVTDPTAFLDFEDGTFKDWTVLNAWTVTDVSPITGTYSATLSDPLVANSYIYKDIACGPGDAFFCSFDYKSVGAVGSNLHVAVVYWGTPIGFNLLANNDQAQAPSAGVTHVAWGPFTAPAGTIDVRIQVFVTAGAIGTWIVDNISLTRVVAGGVSKDAFGNVILNQGGPIFVDVADNPTIRLSSHFVVATVGGHQTLSQGVIDLAHVTGFDTTQFAGGSGTTFFVNALGVDKLIAGDAFFAGQATFSYRDPISHLVFGRVTINSLGITLADAYPTANATVTITASGVTIARSSNNIQISSSLITISSSGGTLFLGSGGFQLNSGTAQIIISPTAVNGGSGMSLVDTVGVLTTWIGAGGIRVNVTSNTNNFGSLGAGALTLTDDASHLTFLTSFIFRMDRLKSVQPVAGSKEFWYDPADGNRVKFVP